MIGMAFVNDWKQLSGLRALLGGFESALYPGASFLIACEWLFFSIFPIFHSNPRLVPPQADGDAQRVLLHQLQGCRRAREHHVLGHVAAERPRWARGMGEW